MYQGGHAMLDYCYFLLLCCLLGCISVKNDLEVLSKEYYRLNLPWVFEKILLYIFWEFSKILIIIGASFLIFRYKQNIFSYLGLVMYFICLTLNYGCSQLYLLFFYWSLSIVLEPQAFQLSLALFLSCLMLTNKKILTIKLTSYLFPLCLVVVSANTYLTLSCLIILLSKEKRLFRHSIKFFSRLSPFP